MECLEIARRYTIRLSELIEENYSNIIIVFSGTRGFHIHVLDFQAGDWTFFDGYDPVKSHEVRRAPLHPLSRPDESNLSPLLSQRLNHANMQADREQDGPREEKRDPHSRRGQPLPSNMAD